MDRALRVLALALALAVPMALVGCDSATAAARRAASAGGAGQEDAAAPVPNEPIVLGPGSGVERAERTRRPVREDDAFFREKWQAASDASAAGDDETALGMISGTLALKPKSPWDERLRSLRAQIHSRHVSTEVLRLDARGDKDYVPFDADVDFLIRLRNVGTTDLVVRPPEGEGERSTTGSTLFLTVTRRDRDVYAETLVTSWKQVVPLLRPGDPEIDLAPGRSTEVRVRIPAEEAGGAISGLRSLEVGGELRADRVEAGTVLPFGRIPIRPGRVVALPSNFEPIAADPLGSLKKAASLDMPVHLLVAVEFVVSKDRPEAMGVLADVLATGPEELRPAALNAILSLRAAAKGDPLPPLVEPLMGALASHAERAAAVMDGLRALTGVSLAPDARLWEDWWRRHGRLSGSLVAPEEDVPAPVKAPKAPKAPK